MRGALRGAEHLTRFPSFYYTIKAKDFQYLIFKFFGKEKFFAGSGRKWPIFSPREAENGLFSRSAVGCGGFPHFIENFFLTNREGCVIIIDTDFVPLAQLDRAIAF